MSATISAATGTALLAVGVVAVGYSVYLEMIHAVPVTWCDRTTVLTPLGVLSLLAGMLLVIE